jgi:Mg/Co/Ni transporter MgtE
MGCFIGSHVVTVMGRYISTHTVTVMGWYRVPYAATLTGMDRGCNIAIQMGNYLYIHMGRCTAIKAILRI